MATTCAMQEGSYGLGEHATKRGSCRIRVATADDAGTIRALIVALAIYEKEPAETVAGPRGPQISAGAAFRRRVAAGCRRGRGVAADGSDRVGTQTIHVTVAASPRRLRTASPAIRAAALRPA